MSLPESAELFYGLNLSKEQKRYVDSIFENQFTIVNAKAGTGKTLLAVGAAYILQKPMVYVFSPVNEDILGYAPGSPEEKEDKYLGPLRDALAELKINPRLAIKSEKNPDSINQKAWITAKSHAYIRGTNIKEATLIIDEAQNFTAEELKKVLTRVHHGKVIMIGHYEQCDLKDVSQSGFIPYMYHFKDEDYVGIHELTQNFRGKLSAKADEFSNGRFDPEHARMFNEIIAEIKAKESKKIA